MTTYTTIPNGDIDQDSPVTQPLLTALRDNPAAIAEGATDASIVAAGWHPYDGVVVGDGNDGVIYDYSVDGGVISVTSPDFEDGYEYALIFTDLTPDSTRNFYIDVSTADGSAWLNLGQASVTAIAHSGHLFLALPRLSQRAVAIYSADIVDSGGSQPFGFSGSTTTNTKLYQFRVRLDFGAFTAGVIKMLRRREYITG